MSEIITVTVPDIGEDEDVEVIEVLVKTGDQIDAEASLVTLESDKASMEIPAPQAGKVMQMLIKVGDKVSTGSPILKLEAKSATTSETKPAAKEKTPDQAATAQAKTSATPVSNAPSDADYDIAVIGAGPGGYTAAFRAADLGLNVVLIERYPTLGGVCLNVGCIPSKALLHTAEIMSEVEALADHGIEYGKVKINLDQLRGFKEKVIGQLTGGLASMAKQRKITTLHGLAKFTSSHTLEISGDKDKQTLSFKHAIIAAGSQTVRIPSFPYDDPRLIDSTGALELTDIPKRLLVIGGGIIGLEMATVYEALGSKVSVVELADGLMPGADRDLVRVLEKRIKKRYENIYLGTKVVKIETQKAGLKVSFEGKKAPASDVYDKVLVAVGRSPNGKNMDAEKAGVQVSDRGFISVDKQMRTNVDHIFAIGDIVGQPMLAHKATHEGKVAAEVCAGEKTYFDARTIPSVAYTNPELAWMGLTETEAKEKNIPYQKGVFPWAASGRALSMGRSDGSTKVLFDPDTGRVLGAGIVGTHAGELIAETVLALEMGCDAHDLGLTIHPHPTLSETVNFAAEVAAGTVTDLYIPKKKKK